MGGNINRPNSLQVPLIQVLAAETAQNAKLREPFPENGVAYADGYVGDDYPFPTKAITEAVLLLARTESVLLDPVYTGKPSPE